MPIFWKVFLSVITVTTLLFTISSHIIVNQSFHQTLEREMETVQQTNSSLYIALRTVLRNDPHNGELSQEELKSLAENIQISTSTGELQFTISDGDTYDTLFSNNDYTLDRQTVQTLPDNSQSQLLRQINGRYYAFAVAKIPLENHMVYVQNYGDVTDVFQLKDGLYRLFLYLLLGLAAIVVLLSILLSLWIVRPIRRLSSASKQIAGGEFSKRVEVTGNDEISDLSREFNTMADHLETTIRALQDGYRRQEDFVGNFAHELKTPLTSIIGYGDMLRSKQLTEEERMEYGDYIYREGRRLEGLSLKLMEIIVLKNEQLTLKNVSVSYLFDSVGNVIFPVLSKCGISLSIEVQEAVVPMEFDLMKTVLLNLMDNSRKAMEQGGKLILSGKLQEDGYEIQVIDNGVGMAQEELSKITEAFYMVDKSRAREQGGAGLGLALCQKVVQLHGGTLTFRSQVGQGTTAIIFLKGVRS